MSKSVQTNLDAKQMAKALKQALLDRNIALTHSECLEIIARQFGLTDWNTFSAKIEAAATDLVLPRNWIVGSTCDEKYYRLGLDPTEPGVALVESRYKRGGVVDLSGQFGVLMQSVLADDFRQGRVKLSAILRTQDTDGASIWMRIDRAPGQLLRFANMLNRQRNGSLRGTQLWTERTIVLDVPMDAASIHFGILLQGHGRVWARSFQLEPVGDDVATTTVVKQYLDKPANLDFSDKELADA